MAGLGIGLARAESIKKHFDRRVSQTDRAI